MPTYQYQCTACGHSFEIVQRFSDDSLTDCPECEGRLRKVFNAVGVVFKGSGFYRTDSRAASSGAKTGSSTSGESTPSGAGTNGSSGSSPSSSSPAPSSSTPSAPAASS